jgi:hypothetical protein
VKERLGKEVSASIDNFFVFCAADHFLLTIGRVLLTFFIFDLQVEMGGCKGPITTFIVEPFIPHKEEFYINIVSDRLGNSISFSECGGIDIEENWDKVFFGCHFVTEYI